MLGGALVSYQASGTLTSLTAAATPASIDRKLPQDRADRVPQIVAAATPSVVEVHVHSVGGRSTGSGTVLTRSGLVLTNYHLVATDVGFADVRVRMSRRADLRKASVVRADPSSDLAVIQVTGEGGFRPATIGDSSTVVPGPQVIAIGSPEGLQNSVSVGVVSAVNRPVPVVGVRKGVGKPVTYDAIQTDAALGPGNSGGPLLDLDGRVVGIDSAGYTTPGGTSSGVGFAIPINAAEHIIAQFGGSA